MLLFGRARLRLGAPPRSCTPGTEDNTMTLVGIEGAHDARLSSMPRETPIVFVVDDDISVRESLELLISNAGWHPETFESAQEFLSRPAVLVPSCLVLDVTLPGLNGLDLQKQVA